MWLMYAAAEGRKDKNVIYVVDDAGDLRVCVPSVPEALIELAELGQTKIGVPVRNEIEIYLIERGCSSGPTPGPLMVRRDPFAQGLRGGLNPGLDLDRMDRRG